MVETSGQTAMMVAAAFDKVEIVEVLKTKEIKMQRKDGMTALMMCADRGSINSAKLLLEEAGMKTKDERIIKTENNEETKVVIE